MLANPGSGLTFPRPQSSAWLLNSLPSSNSLVGKHTLKEKVSNAEALRKILRCVTSHKIEEEKERAVRGKTRGQKAEKGNKAIGDKSYWLEEERQTDDLNG